MKHPLVALFFRLDQSERVQIKQVVLDEADLFFGHAAALQINRDAGKMGRGGVAIRRSSVAIVAAKFFLHHDGTDGGVDLDLIVELAVINLGKVVDEVARPGTAVAARRIETFVNAERFAFFNRNQFMRRFQFFEFVVVLNTWQIETVDFLILAEQGIVRRTEQRIPEQASKTAETKGMQNAVAMMRGGTQGRRCAGRGNQNEQR